VNIRRQHVLEIETRARASYSAFKHQQADAERASLYRQSEDYLMVCRESGSLIEKMYWTLDCRNSEYEKINANFIAIAIYRFKMYLIL
jgi:hypothetical protein